MRPGPCGLDLPGDLQQRVLAERLADDLDVGRQIVLAEADRDGDRRLARNVEQRRERGERARAGEVLAGPTAFATWDEALMLAVPMIAAGGPAGLEALGVRPRRMAEVLGA